MAAPVTFALKLFETRQGTARYCSALGAGLTMDVTVLREGAVLSLLYRLKGDLSKVVVPAANKQPSRRDRLWEQTCFEFFLSAQPLPRKGMPYWEFNLSPAGDWNVFSLQSYRHRSEQERALTSLPFTVQSSPAALYLAVLADISNLVDPAQPLKMGISAVVVVMGERALRETFWAIAHPTSQPDFHHPGSFTVELML